MTFTTVPADLLAIEADTLAGADTGGFEIVDGGLLWCARWVGDAPGSDPVDTTYGVLREARIKVQALGYHVGGVFYDHDTAMFGMVEAAKP